jgi:Ca2+-transporting ATPase
MEGDGVVHHTSEIGEVFAAFRTGPAGLSATEAARRLQDTGPNELVEARRRGPLAMLADQFKDFLILVLLAAALVAGAVGKPTDALAIVAIVVLNAVVGFLQEHRAQRAIEALRAMSGLEATALRDGAPTVVVVGGLVPGDVVLLEAGSIVPADLRLIEVTQLRIQEAALTGESVPVEKNARLLHDEGLPLGDRRNMAYRGTAVSMGRGRGVVVATGMATELGKIAALLQEAEDTKTPLQRRLAGFGQRLAVAILGICAVVFLAGLFRGEPAAIMFLTAVSLAVAAIPEALPAVITVALALGARRMARERALVRRLPAVETLGSITYICSDKTGTLTLNRMTVEEVFLDERAGRPGWRVASGGDGDLLCRSLVLCNDASLDGAGQPAGDPTEVALLVFAAEEGFRKEELDVAFPRLAELPFDSDRKCMTTFHDLGPQGVWSFTKGAAEVVAAACGERLTARGVEPLDPAEVGRAGEQMAADGLRVLAVGYRRWEAVPADVSPETAERGLILVGLVGLLDPPRPEAAEAVDRCRNAGIEPVMITGDHPATAGVIARRLGILAQEGEEGVTTGREVEGLSQKDLEARVESVRVYARVAPEQKLRIVRALQARGQLVAMTGDGVNDAPALKRADIGVAMGITGTDVAKEAAALVLLDDNFATIVHAVEEGRRIYDNILRFIRYSMTANAATLWAIFLAPLFGLPLPLLPIQILWINLLTDSLPGLALTAEAAEANVMRRPPRSPTEGVFAHGLGHFVASFGLATGVLLLLFQAFALREGLPWQTMVFTAVIVGRISVAVGVRSTRESVLRKGLFGNPFLFGAVALTATLQLAAVYVPAFRQIFRTVPLSARELGVTVAFALPVLALMEGVKLYGRIVEAWRRRGGPPGREREP